MASRFSWHSRSSRPSDPVVVIGLGRFGTAVAYSLEEAGVEVLGVDRDIALVDTQAGKLTHVVAGDCTDPDTLRDLAITEAKRVVLAIGEDLEDSVLIASLLVEAEIPELYAKVATKAQARILRRLGVRHVISPEHDAGARLARRLLASVTDVVELDGYALAEVMVPRRFQGKTVCELQLRDRHQVSVLAVRDDEGEDMVTAMTSTRLTEGMSVVLAGSIEAIEAFAAEH